MKHFALLLSSVCLLVAPTLPAQASLVAATPPVDNMHCLSLLLSDPDAHAAECGGPFTIDKGTAPLGGSGYGEGCRLIAMIDPPVFADIWAANAPRVRVAVESCCQGAYLTPEILDLSIGEAIRVAQSCLN
jgi:hypothetical protein